MTFMHRGSQASSVSNQTYKKRLTLVGIAAVGLLALSGCSGTSNEQHSNDAGASPSSGSPTSSATSTTAPSSTSPSSPPASTPAQPQAGAHCAASQLSGAVSTSEGAAGSSILQLTVTNSSSVMCVLDGYPGVSMVGNGNGTQIGAAAQRDASRPSPGPIQLEPGAQASLLMKVSTAQNYPNCNPHAVDGFRVYPPSATDALFVNFKTTGCTAEDVKLMQIGAFGAK